MSSAAIVHAVPPAESHGPPLLPLVFVDGHPRPEFDVREVVATGPLGTRVATIMMRRDAPMSAADERARVDRLVGASVQVLQPITLDGGEPRLHPVMRGRFDRVEQRFDGDDDRFTLHAVCDWSAALARMIEPGAIDRSRSAAWTVGSLLRHASRLGGLGLDVESLTAEAAGVIDDTDDIRHDTFAALVESLCRDHHLLIDNAARWEGHAVRVSHRVITAGSARPLRLSLSDTGVARQAVESIRRGIDTAQATKLVAHARGAVVESTFDLIGAWDPARESHADDAYGKSTSEDFDTVANVFRHWALNEDGAYTAAPFNRGVPFDLSSLFDDGRVVAPQPLRFERMLTMDDAGRRMGVVVQASVDGGDTWRPVLSPPEPASQPDILAFAPDGTTAYARFGYGFPLQISRDSGQQWQPQPSAEGELISFASSAPTSDNALIAVPEYETRLLRAGPTTPPWQVVGQLPPELTSVQAVVTGPNDTIFVGGQGGLFRSSDTGQSWQPAARNLPAGANVKELHARNGYLFAALADGALYVSPDRGDSWQEISVVE